MASDLVGFYGIAFGASKQSVGQFEYFRQFMLLGFLPGAFGHNRGTAWRISLRFEGTAPSDSIHQNPRRLFLSARCWIVPNFLTKMLRKWECEKIGIGLE
ncbi:MAG: hypothetical protein H6Q42_2571 [Deltaproteobacteria bacterium]|jgi:hypothetical protein|nr:hypothetical protein [Deltaproteobacteria bacterium]